MADGSPNRCPQPSPRRSWVAAAVIVVRKRSLKCATRSLPRSALALAATAAQSMLWRSRVVTVGAPFCSCQMAAPDRDWPAKRPTCRPRIGGHGDEVPAALPEKTIDPTCDRQRAERDEKVSSSGPLREQAPGRAEGRMRR